MIRILLNWIELWNSGTRNSVVFRAMHSLNSGLWLCEYMCVCVCVAVSIAIAVALSISMSCALNYKAMNSIITWYNQFTERYIQLQSDAFSEFSFLTMCVYVCVFVWMCVWGSGSEYEYELYTQLQSDELNYRVMHSITKWCILWIQLSDYVCVYICMWQWHQVWVCAIHSITERVFMEFRNPRIQ